MAKLTNEQAQERLNKLATTIKKMSDAGIEVDEMLTAEFDRLTKQLTGSASNKTADFFNANVAAQYNESQEAVLEVEKVIGTRQRITVAIVTAEDGTKKLVFSGGKDGSTGGTKTGSAGGSGNKQSTPYNHHVVTLLTDVAGYPSKSFESATASAALAFILNNGKNPMNLAAYWRSADSGKRALDAIEKIAEFNTNFKLERTYVEPAKTEAPVVTEPTSDEPTV